MEQRQRVHTQIKHRLLRRMVVEFTVMIMLIKCSIRIKMKNATQKQRPVWKSLLGITPDWRQMAIENPVSSDF